MNLRLTHLAQFQALPTGSVVARDNGVVWRKATAGWRSEHGMTDWISDENLASLSAGDKEPLVLLRHGWLAPSTPAAPTARDEVWLQQQTGCAHLAEAVTAAVVALLTWKLARRG